MPKKVVLTKKRLLRLREKKVLEKSGSKHQAKALKPTKPLKEKKTNRGDKKEKENSPLNPLSLAQAKIQAKIDGKNLEQIKRKERKEKMMRLQEILKQCVHIVRQQHAEEEKRKKKTRQRKRY